MKKLICITFLLIYCLFSFAQVENNKDNATALANIKVFKSEKAEFSTSKLLYDQPIGNCYNKSFTYGKWFKFLATSNELEACVKIDNGHGTMQQPFLYLFDENLNIITCEEPLDDTTNISIISTNIAVGSWYYLVVYNMNHSMYVGSFTLEINDKISNDYAQGATLISNPNNWCSDEASLTVSGGTPDGAKPSCMTKGPNFNKWYKFKAISNKASVEVKYESNFGTAQFPYLAIWDEQFKEISCDGYTDDNQSTKIDINNLTAGKTYYISVDHQYNHKYIGTYTLCVNNSSSNENDIVVQTTDLQKANLEKIVGKLMFKTDYNPKTDQKISLFQDSKLIRTTTTDPNGRFVFNNIEPNKNFMVVIENQGDDLLFEIYQTNSIGEIVKQAIKHNKSSFGFDELSPSCNKIVLLDCNRSFDLNINPGKIGMIGKVVNKQSPINSINDVSVYLYDNTKNVLDSTKTNVNGDFKFINLVPSDNYMIKLGINLDKVFAEMLVVNDQGQAISSSSSKNAGPDGFFKFEKLPYMEAGPIKKMNFEDVDINIAAFNTGESIVMNNIYFDPGKSEILAKSYTELDKLVTLLTKNKSLKIEIGGHTDNFGTDDMNLSLSKERAMAVQQYIISKGVDASRLSHKGYGCSKPVGSNETEEGRKKNRRVEFIVQ